ncbi:cation:proton antiporter [Synechococcus elongatus]|uniref:Cation:proton antiporter n=1 Tax=Synechococcus elongatus PCC 11802 TaxID=2283154 RepID=A0AAT9JXC6_SYNEL|nr:cation:proton antiporter [Synechococcus elongatus]QFZ91889.1 cation:proton antiporter [Synechococcus elongatus PCC 11802]
MFPLFSPALGWPPLLAQTIEVIESPEASTLILVSVLLGLVVVYLASKVGGELCVRANLPPVLGELLGGVIVGTSVLKLLVFPSSGTGAEDVVLLNFLQQISGAPDNWMPTIFATQSEVISVLSEIGVIILLFEIGLESNLDELLKVGAKAAIVATVGVAAPFAAGTLGLMYLFHIATIPAIFAGAALTATSIGITAKVLSELGKLNSPEGQIIIGAAIIDDILGIIVLAVVSSLAKTGEIRPSNIIILIVSSTAFLVGAIFIGRWLNPFFVNLVSNMQTRGEVLVVALVAAIIVGLIAQFVRLEAILGAFAVGLILAETEKGEELKKQVTPLADVLVPIFFVVVGAKTDLSVLNPTDPVNRAGLIIAGFLLVVAVIGKVITGFSLVGSSTPINRLAIGVGMIPRGEVGLVFAGVGASSGILSESLNAGVIVMVIMTTFLAPPLLRLAFRGSTETVVEPGS